MIEQCLDLVTPICVLKNAVSISVMITDGLTYSNRFRSCELDTCFFQNCLEVVSLPVTIFDNNWTSIRREGQSKANRQSHFTTRFGHSTDFFSYFGETGKLEYA